MDDDKLQELISDFEDAVGNQYSAYEWGAGVHSARADVLTTRGNLREYVIALQAENARLRAELEQARDGFRKYRKPAP